MINLKRMWLEDNYCTLHLATEDEAEKRQIRFEMWLMDYLQPVAMLGAMATSIAFVRWLFS